MNLRRTRANVHPSADGRKVLAIAGIEMPDEAAALAVQVEESEDLGLWVSISRQDETHLFLLRWDYILGIDLPGELGKKVGLKG